MSINDEIKALERRLKELRKQAKEKPMDGIPVKDGPWSVFGNGTACMPINKAEEYIPVLNQFSSVESAKKHSEMMTMWRQALVNSKEGEPIDIEVILPFLKKGYVAMDKNGLWSWYKDEPSLNRRENRWSPTSTVWSDIKLFNLKSVTDWEFSLKKCDKRKGD